MKPEVLNRESFKQIFKEALESVHISKNKIESFLKDDSSLRLRDIGVCFAISNPIDNYIRRKIPEYDGSLTKETFNDIYEYNNSFMYEQSKKKK